MNHKNVNSRMNVILARISLVCAVLTLSPGMLDIPKASADPGSECPNTRTLKKVASSDTTQSNGTIYTIDCSAFCEGACKRIYAITPDLYICKAAGYVGSGCYWTSGTFTYTCQVGECIQTAGGNCGCTSYQPPVRVINGTLMTGVACP
jgi:hypothetical protein